MDMKDLIQAILQDAMDLSEEIDWDDKTLPDIFEEDLRNAFAVLARSMYAVHGYQCWNMKGCETKDEES